MMPVHGKAATPVHVCIAKVHVHSMAELSPWSLMQSPGPSNHQSGQRLCTKKIVPGLNRPDT